MPAKKIPTPTGEVHAVADLFPMLPDDELQELADSIAANGQQLPIVLDANGVLLDGRNRLKACELAGVDPTFVTHRGQPVAYILDANVRRRHLTKSQQAMAVVLAGISSGNTMREVAEETGTSAATLAKASLVAEYAPELTNDVLAGTLPLNDAYEQAQEAKASQEERDLEAERATQQMARLRADAPDLTELVETDRLQVSEAVALLDTRERDERDRRLRDAIAFGNTVAKLWSLLDPDPTAIVTEWTEGVTETLDIEHFAHLRTGDGLRALADNLTACAAAVDERGALT